MSKDNISTNIVAGCVSFFFFLFIGKRIGSRISVAFSSYREADTAIKQEWDVRINSTIHAILASILGLTVLWSDMDAFYNPLWHNSWISSTTIIISSAYLVADAMNMLFFLPKYYDGFWAELTHHLSIAFTFIMCVANGVYVHILVVRNLAEISTPFVNLRWSMAVANCKNTRFYTINGIILFASFFLVRIFSMPYVYVQLYLHRDEWLRMGNLVYLPLCAVIVDILNLFWFSRIAKGLLKYLKAGDKGVKKS